MSKIRKETFKSGNLSFEMHIEYTPRDQLFFVRLPDEYGQLIGEEPFDSYCKDMRVRSGPWGKKYFADQTEEELINHVQEYLDFYVAQKTTKKKVILYRFNATGRSFESRDWGAAVKKSDDEVSVKFEYKICELTQIADKKEYTEPGHYKMSDHDVECFHEIDYREDVEKFFKEFYSALEKLITKADKYINNETKLLEAVTGMKQLFKT